MRKIVFVVAGLAALMILIAGWYLLRPAGEWVGAVPSVSPAVQERETVATEIPPAPPEPGATPEQPAFSPLPPTPLSDPADRSPLADNLLKKGNTGMEDLRIVFTLFDSYRERFGGIPTGEDNATVVNALTGNNPKRLAFIPRDHSAINDRGELTDRWNTPLFFHIESRDALDIRSAGPDREMYTEDDLVYRSPGLRVNGVEGE